MTFIKNKILIIIFSLFISVGELLSANNPPSPRGSGGFVDTGGVVGSPIDDLVPIVLVIALLYGVWIKYKQSKHYNLS